MENLVLLLLCPSFMRGQTKDYGLSMFSFVHFLEN